MKRVVVTGGAGFLGSHLCEALLDRGDEVVCVDDLSTGRLENLIALENSKRFQFVQSDVTEGIEISGQIDAVLHLASPASPPDYLDRPLETLRVGSRGTDAALERAEQDGARFVLASTSEIYGDPLVHPQSEEYWGNVNPIGPRSVYDEAKRFAEALTMAHGRARRANVGIVRIFNTYGPRLRRGDGRVVSNFITQALFGDPITIQGTGNQTRSFCYVRDLVRGLLMMLDSGASGPINLGNPTEITITELAELVLKITGSTSRIVYRPLPVDDPTRRKPNISKAQTMLGWEPSIGISEGLRLTVEWFESQLGIRG